MAPIGDKNSQIDSANEDSEAQDLWASILSDAQTSSSSHLPSCKSILVLGENESGKTTLVAKLQGNEDPKRGQGLEFHYLNVKDEIRDEHTRLGTWIVDGDPHHTPLLKFALNEENFEHTLVLLVVSMNQPWSIIDSLKKWSSILRDHIELLRISRDKKKEFEQSLVCYFQEYVDPADESQQTHSQSRRGPNPLHPVSTTDDEKILLPLGETTLTHNLGIPIVVVVTKSDAISTLEKENDYREEHFDFIQQYIRKFCLNYGASIVYTSVKEGKNCDLLHKYLLHRIYGFPFKSSASVVERDAVFIPAGWDNEKKVSILYENMTSMKHDDNFDDIIAKPVTRKPIQRDLEALAEEEQTFLLKQQMLLNKSAPAQGGGGPRQESPLRSSSTQKAPTRSPVSVAASGNMASPKKVDRAGGPPGTSEGVLANFFNSLLSKKSGAQPGVVGKTDDYTGMDSDKAAVTRDAAAELEKLTRAKKPVTSGQNNDVGDES